MDEALQTFRKSFPVLMQGKVLFVRQRDTAPSRIDPAQFITRDNWALTLVCHGLSKNCLPSDSPSILGHSVVLLEKINENGVYNRNIIHLTYQERVLGIEIREGMAGFDRRWPRTDTYLRSAYLINQMIEEVLRQKQSIENAYANGTPLPFNYCAQGESDDFPGKNCHTWCLEMLLIAKVIIPWVSLSLPGHPICYIPRYSVGSIEQLCKKLVKQIFRGGMVKIGNAQVLSAVGGPPEIEHSMLLRKTSIKVMGAALAGMFLVPGAQLGLPAGILFLPPLMIYQKIEINKLEKQMILLQTERLKRYFLEASDLVIRDFSSDPSESEIDTEKNSGLSTESGAEIASFSIDKFPEISDMFDNSESI